MSLADALATETTKNRGPRCTMCLLITSLPKADREALLGALGDDRFTTAAITRALRAEGHAVTAHTVARHRKGECLGVLG